MRVELEPPSPFMHMHVQMQRSNPKKVDGAILVRDLYERKRTKNRAIKSVFKDNGVFKKEKDVAVVPFGRNFWCYAYFARSV